MYVPQGCIQDLEAWGAFKIAASSIDARGAFKIAAASLEATF